MLLLHFLGAFDIMELKLYDLRFKIRGPISGMDSNSALPSPEEFVDLTEPFNDANGNGNWDKEESYSDVNENKKYDMRTQIDNAMQWCKKNNVEIKNKV